jgi:hypothetical protein
MKRIVWILGSYFLLSACTADSLEQKTQAANEKIKKCPPATLTYLAATGKQESFYDRFDFYVSRIVADNETLNFQTSKYDFIFCRGNQSWIVKPGTLPAKFRQQNYPENSAKFQTIKFGNQSYQYRVVLDRASNQDKNRSQFKPAKQVVFELITLPGKNRQRRTLYTLKELQANGNQGAHLGPPRITAVVVWENRIWWSVAFEQGEGNDGIATIVSYEPQANKITFIKPPGLVSYQITDLAITGNINNPTFWLGTKISAEGNFSLPGKGLVVYRPNPQNWNSGSLASYNVHNSPLVGAVPKRLRREDNILWVGTGNGVCQIRLPAVDNPQNWSCWRFAVMAKLPPAGLSVSSELSQKASAFTLYPAKDRETVEVLWWSPVNLQTRRGRYEIRTEKGLLVKVNQGATIRQFRRFLPPGKPPVDWPGFEWHWNGQRFVRGFDEVALNLSGGGPGGIGVTLEPTTGRTTANAIRGDLDLLEISPKFTKVKYYSGWVDEAKLKPYLTVLPHARPQIRRPNPLAAIANR